MIQQVGLQMMGAGFRFGVDISNRAFFEQVTQLRVWGTPLTLILRSYNLY